jgi:ribose transport system substrate-binding protein
MKVLLAILLVLCLGLFAFAADSKGAMVAIVQGVKGHPVHHIVQLGFIEKAKALGMKPEIDGVDSGDVSELIGAGEAAIAKGVKGAMWWSGGLPAFNPLYESLKEKGGYNVVAHFPIKQEDSPALHANASADPYTYGQKVAEAIMKKINKPNAKFAVTQGSLNVTENAAAQGFADYMKAKFPKVTVLPVVEEGFDPPVAISRAVAIVQANPDLNGAFSTTGAGPQTWSGAAAQAGKKDLVIISMDYTEQNIDLVKSGKVFAIVAQPLYDEAAWCADTLSKLIKGQKVPYFTKLEAPVTTKDGIDKYLGIIQKVKSFNFSEY